MSLGYVLIPKSHFAFCDDGVFVKCSVVLPALASIQQVTNFTEDRIFEARVPYDAVESSTIGFSSTSLVSSRSQTLKSKNFITE